MERINKASQAYHGTLKSLNGTADHFRSTVAGVAATIGGTSLFFSAGRQALQFNSTLEQSQIGIAALVRTFAEADGKTMDFSEAMGVAGDIQKRLQIEGLKTTATYEQLLQALQEGIGPAMKAGFNPEQVVKFTSLMTQAAAAMGVPMDQLGQEIRSILDGTIDANSRVAKSLGLTNDKIKQMAAQGKLFDYLSARLDAFGAAGEELESTFSGAWSNVQDAIGTAIGTSMNTAFRSTTDFLLRLKDAIVSVDEEAGTFTFNERIVTAFRSVDQAISAVLNKLGTDELAGMVASFIEMFGAVARAVISFVSVLAQLWQVLGPFAPALVAVAANVMIWGNAFKAILGLPIELYRQIMALNSGLVVLQAVKLPAWLAATTASFSVLQLAVAGLTSYLAGLSLGNWLYKLTDPAERALSSLQQEVDATEAKFRQFVNFRPETQSDLFSKPRADLEKYKQDLEGAYRHQVAVVQQLTIKSRDRNIFGWLTDEAKNAAPALSDAKAQLKNLERAMDEYGEVAEQANDQAASSATTAAGTMKKVTGDALKEMQKKYQDYAKEVQRINDDISSRTRSLYAELRDMARSGMSDVSAWKDQRAEAEEYMAAARKAADEARSAMSAGDEITAAAKWKEAVQYADDAKQAYKSLNTEVKSGDQVVISQQQALRTSFDGVREAGELGIELLKQQRAATRDAMAEFEGESTFAELTEGMDASQKKWLENWESMSSYTMEQIEKIDLALDRVASKPRTATLSVQYEGGYRTGGLIGGYRLGGVIQALASGGGVRNILGGGKLSGYGGGDRRLLLGEDGEVMLRKESVRAAGLRAALAFNSGRWDVVMTELSKRMHDRVGYQLGGLLGSLPEMPQRLAVGGAVGGTAAGDFGTLTLNFPSGASVPVMTTRDSARALTREFKRMAQRSSS